MSEWVTGYDKKNKLWRGPVRTRRFHDFDCSIGEIIFKALRNYAKNIVQISYPDKRVVTNQEALLWGISLATYFQNDLGLTHEDVVGIVATNTTHLIAVELGCLFNATPFHAVNPTFSEAELTQILGITRPKIIFCNSINYSKIVNATSAYKPLICTMSSYQEGTPKVEDFLHLVPPEVVFMYRPVRLVGGGNQTVAILCSSGTTGLPKAVCLSNYRLIEDYGFLTNEDVLYSSSGLDWASGLLTSILSCSYGCTRVISPNTFSLDHFCEVVEEHGVTLTMLAQFHVIAIVNAPLKTVERLRSLRYLGIVGGAISPSNLSKLEALLPGVYIRLGWGFSEFGVATVNTALAPDDHAGKLSTGISACVVDEESGQRLGPNEVGEIYVHDGRIWNGYYNDVKETQCMQDELNWFHSGDLGYFDDQEHLHISGRKKEICKYQGFHYWLNEIENVVEELPAVLAACVVGIEDESNGDAAAAAVSIRPGFALTEEEVKAHVRNRLVSSHKQLHGGVWFFEECEIPYSRNGKKLRRETRLLINEKLKLTPVKQKI